MVWLPSNDCAGLRSPAPPTLCAGAGPGISHESVLRRIRERVPCRASPNKRYDARRSTVRLIVATQSREIRVGTWGTGRFDSDSAADFAVSLDRASLPEREALIHGVLERTAVASGYLFEASEAVAAAALVAAQCAGGEPVDGDDGPQQPMPVFPAGVRTLAAAALARVAAKESGLVETWVVPADAREWLSAITRLREILDPSQATSAR
jgi:Domain of unknown function (DUF4259)